MSEKLRDRIVNGIISLIVSSIILYITFSSNAYSNKADKVEVYKIERNLKDDIDDIKNEFKLHLQNEKEFQRDLSKKLDDHQKQIIEIIKH